MFADTARRQVHHLRHSRLDLFRRDVAGAVVVAVAAWSTAAGTTWVPAVPVADPEADAEADGLPATAAAATAAARHAPKARLIAHARGKGVLLRVLFVTAPRTTPSVKAAARILL